MTLAPTSPCTLAWTSLHIKQLTIHRVCRDGSHVCRYEDDAWEILLGYDQEKSMGERAGAALVEDLKTVDRQGRTPADDV